MGRAIRQHDGQHNMLSLRQISHTQHSRLLAVKNSYLALFIQIIFEQTHGAPHAEHVVHGPLLSRFADVQKTRRRQRIVTTTTAPQSWANQALTVFALGIFPGGSALTISFALQHLLGKG